MPKPQPTPKRLSLPHRLYVRIYIALLASLIAAGSLFALVHWIYDPEQIRSSFDTFGEIASEVLPPPSAVREEQQKALWRWRRKVHADLALYSANGELIASAGRPLPPLPAGQSVNGRIDGGRGAFAVKLPDERWLLVKRTHGRRMQVSIVMILALVAAIVGIGAFPVVRRLTRRLENLQGSVEQWGGGQLSTRVPVEGRDEVAQLATSFNNSAERIEALVNAQKSLLANASHELRSPLARIRMAVELMQEQASPAIRDELNHNIAELDQLIDEVLLASRLDAAAPGAASHAEVDLTAIVAEECARVGAGFEAAALTVHGDAKLLRRLVRNLLENAMRYGGETPVTLDLQAVEDGVRLDVGDSGPGVPEAERERIFEPFYRLPGASEASGGVGLGLSLVRQIALHHGGSVVCLGNRQRGCCFRVTLPASRTTA